MRLTADQLRQCMPLCPAAHVDEYARLLSETMTQSEINTVARAACYLGQLAHESGELRYLEELADGSAYELRRDLGNVQEGWGRLYKGRGWIQLTGRLNYELAGVALGVDLVGTPRLAAEPATAACVAAWYWRTHGCSLLADGMDVPGITRAINGGLTHLAERQAATDRALAALVRTAVIA